MPLESCFLQGGGWVSDPDPSKKSWETSEVLNGAVMVVDVVGNTLSPKNGSRLVRLSKAPEQENTNQHFFGVLAVTNIFGIFSPHVI